MANIREFNGQIETPGNPAQDVRLRLSRVMPVTQIRTGAGAINPKSGIVHIVTTGTDALTLADGEEHDELVLIMKTDGGTGTLTPDTLANGTDIIFDDVGDSAHLYYTNNAWHFMGGTSDHSLKGNTANENILRTMVWNITPGATPGTDITTSDLSSTRGYNELTTTDATDLAKNASSGDWDLNSAGTLLSFSPTETIVGIVSNSIVLHDLNS